MTSNDRVSTSAPKSTLDNITGTVQQAVGNLFGNPSDARAGQAKQDKAQFEDAASHATIKGPGFSATSDGVARDDPQRQKGAWNQTIGAGKETVGGLVGSEQLKRDGREQNLAGQGQEAQGQISDLGSGVKDRVSGRVGEAVAGIAGDREAQIEAQRQHDLGKTRQRGAEHDIHKQNY